VLADSEPTTESAPYHARLVKEKWLSRTLIETMSGYSRRLFGGEDAREVLSEAQTQLTELARSDTASTYEHPDNIVHSCTLGNTLYDYSAASSIQRP
jgi:replicative DNA helicase